jgi:inhibitor of KinA
MGGPLNPVPTGVQSGCALGHYPIRSGESHAKIDAQERHSMKTDATTVQPLGDAAAMASCPDEVTAVRLAAAMRRAAPPWLIDVVGAYSTVAVFFDPDQTRFADVAEFLRVLSEQPPTPGEDVGRLHLVPCCYALQQDLERVARHCGLPAAEVIRLHSGVEYTVYAVGFSPGFPYLGYLPDELCGVPRRETPRVRVPAGSVGLTGRQTGIYPQERPGGWNLIGRTPFQLVDVADGYFPLRVGDRVQFTAIEEVEYQRFLGGRL